MCHSHSQQTQTVKHISSLRRYLTEDATKQLVTTCALSRLDYCSSVLMGTPNSVIQPVQKVHSTAAHLNLIASHHQSHTPLIQNFTDTGSQFLKKFNPILLSGVKRSHRFFLSYLFEYCTFTTLPALLVLYQTHAQTPVLPPQNPWLLFILSLWPPHLEQSPPRHQALCFLFLQKQTQDISLLQIF